MIPTSHTVTVPNALIERYCNDLVDYWNEECADGTSFNWRDQGDHHIVQGTFLALKHGRDFVDWHRWFMAEFTVFLYPAPTPSVFDGVDLLSYEAIHINNRLWREIKEWSDIYGLDSDKDMRIDTVREIYRFRDANTALLFRLRFG